MSTALIITLCCVVFLAIRSNGQVAPTPIGPTAPPAPAVANITSTIINVVAFGATGDGVHDDTASFEAAIAHLFGTSTGGVLYIPSGSYRLTSTLQIPNSNPFTMQGDGWQTILLWEVVGHLFQWPSNVTAIPVSGLLLRDFVVSVASSWSAAPVSTPFFAFSISCGLTQSLVHHVKVTSAYSGFGVSGIDMGYITDTVEWAHNVLWMLTGIGVRIGKGSEVRITGGRIISLGAYQSPSGAIGVHVTGNNGGVPVLSTDVIGWNRGIVLDASNGAGSNREIFINQATVDSNYRGLAIHDNSYVDITGCWAASSVVDNIWTAPNSSPQLVITGGTIFNSGTYGGNCSSGECNGITLNGGSVTLSSLEIRNNQGRGLWIPNGAVTDVMITGVKFFGNGVSGIDIDGGLSGLCMISMSMGYQNGPMVIPEMSDCVQNGNLFR